MSKSWRAHPHGDWTCTRKTRDTEADLDTWDPQKSSLASLFTEDTYFVPGLWLLTPKDFSFSIYYFQDLASGFADTTGARSLTVPWTTDHRG